jgi:hypothetical protein
MARRLGVSTQRVHQMESSGALVAPERDADGDVAGWPETYAESVVLRRQGRQVSQSVFGLTPAHAAVALGDDAVFQLQSEDRLPIYAMRLEHPESSVVLLQALASEPDTSFAGIVTPGQARSVRPDSSEMRLAIKRASERWFGGDVTRATFIVVTEQHAGSEFWDVIVTDDPTSAEQRRIAPHWLAMDEREGLPVVEETRVSASILAQRLGRPVPAFLPRHFSPSVLEQWQARGRVPIEIVRDYSREELLVTAATLIQPLPHVAADVREVLVSALLCDVRWDGSGAVPDLPAAMRAGLADWKDDVGAVAQQLVLRQSDFTSRAGSLRSFSVEPPLDPIEYLTVANTVRDLMFERYGDSGVAPDARVHRALETGLDALYGRTHMAAIQTEGYDYELVASLPPRGVPPYTFRNWTIPKAHPGTGAVHELTRAWEHDRTRVTQAADDAAFRTIEAELLRLAEFTTTLEERRALQPLFFADVAGVHVGRLETEGEVIYCVGVPVLRTRGDLTGPVRSFTSIVVEPDAQTRPVLLATPEGPTVMPFGRPFAGSFTHGYNGSGPGNLEDAILGFLGKLHGQELPQTTTALVRSAVVNAAQDQPLEIPRSLLGI